MRRQCAFQASGRWPAVGTRNVHTLQDMNASTSRALLRATLVLATAAAAAAAHADHRLFPTDVLTSGEADVQATFERSEVKQDNAPHLKVTTKAGDATVRLGYGAQTHFSFSLARADITTTSDGASRASENATAGAVGIRHALALEGPVSVAFNASLAHAKGEGQSSNLYSVGVSAGLKLPSSAVRPYLSADVTVPDNDKGATTWDFEAGAWIPVHSRITVIPALTVARSDETYATESGHAVGLNLSALVQLNERAYVQPTLSYAKGSIGDEDGKTTAASVSLYYKF